MSRPWRSGPVVEHLDAAGSEAARVAMTRKNFPCSTRRCSSPRSSTRCASSIPRQQWRNPVMFVVYVGSIFTTALVVQALGGQGEAPAWFIVAITLWLWFTVLFANFAEALAEGRSKAQAAALRGAKKQTWAKKLREPRYGAEVDPIESSATCAGATWYWSRPAT